MPEPAEGRRGEVRIGTSGWVYPHWRSAFYPTRIPQKGWLEWYATRFSTVEVNATFYRLPAASTFLGWYERTPPDFVFACKASRGITHLRKLREAAPLAAVFLERVAVLGRKLGPILFQLPPRWACDEGRLAAFLTGLPSGGRHVFEFRDPSWWRDPVFRLLEHHGCAFCIQDLRGRESPVVLTAPFVYVRLHGPREAYRGSYTPAALARWAARIEGWARSGRDVYVYFDNDEGAFAPKNASQLVDLLGPHAGGPGP